MHQRHDATRPFWRHWREFSRMSPALEHVSSFCRPHCSSLLVQSSLCSHNLVLMKLPPLFIDKIMNARDVTEGGATS